MRFFKNMMLSYGLTLGMGVGAALPALAQSNTKTNLTGMWGATARTTVIADGSVTRAVPTTRFFLVLNDRNGVVTGDAYLCSSNAYADLAQHVTVSGMVKNGVVNLRAGKNALVLGDSFIKPKMPGVHSVQYDHALQLRVDNDTLAGTRAYASAAAFAVQNGRTMVGQTDDFDDYGADKNTHDVTFTRVTASDITALCGCNVTEPVADDTPEFAPIYFKRGTTEFLTNADSLAAVDIGRYLNAHKDTRVLLTGHTDILGHAGKNMELSEQRAEKIKKMLNKTMGVARSRMETAALGGRDPATRAVKTVDDGNANRRVTATVITPE